LCASHTWAPLLVVSEKDMDPTWPSGSTYCVNTVSECSGLALAIACSPRGAEGLNGLTGIALLSPSPAPLCVRVGDAVRPPKLALAPPPPVNCTTAASVAEAGV